MSAIRIKLGIANSSPLIALMRIDRIDLLSATFETLIVPEAVASEVGVIPASIQVVELSRPERLVTFPQQLHSGECAAILLALDASPAPVLLIDDWYARAFAARLGVKLMGTIGLIVRAKRAGLVDSATRLFEDLVRADFRVSERLLAEAKVLAGE